MMRSNYSFVTAWLTISLNSCLIHLSETFAPSFKLSTVQQYNNSARLFPSLSSTIESNDAEGTTNQHTTNNNIILISFDGAVADTSSWRSNLAIDIAYQTWKSDELLKHYNLDNSNDEDYDGVAPTDRSWVVNKINALMQHLLSDQNGLTNCDAVLLTRLILEEQLLDNGRSVGKSGKYASKYHPNSITSASSSSSNMEDLNESGDESVSGSNQGSRPLTVGEIEANWSKGACLRDTVRIKYNVDRKDPIPIITDNICQTLAEENYNDSSPLPILHGDIIKTLSSSSNNDDDCTVYIMVGHESHLQIASKTLGSTIPHEIIHSLDETTLNKNLNMDTKPKRIYLIAPGEGDRDHIGILQQMIMSCEAGTSIHFIHPIVEKLQQAKVLYGDNRYVQSSIYKNKKVS